ncbi:hypothetical protein PG997_013522 [Apiospora hydei]|uniref:Uncharacterized protein n=1 Tax=Apiospora hydei TaxID=1337664 RepID=A0ABR1V6E9_9PEZI
MATSSTPHSRSGLSSVLLLLLTTIFTFAALVSARPLTTTSSRSTSPISLSLGLTGAVAEAPGAPLHLAPFPNENSTDAHIIPDEYIITLVPDSSYAQLDAFMTETPSDPPRFDSYLWAHGVSAGWIYQVRTFPGTKQVSHNGYAQAAAPRGW